MGKFNDYLIRHAVESASKSKGILDSKPQRHKANLKAGKGIIQGPTEFLIGRGLDAMYKEEMKNYRARAKYLNERDLLAEAALQSPKRYEVHQPWDPIIHDDLWW